MTAPPWARKLYEGWMRIVARFGHVQTLIILVIFYGFLVGPIALGAAVARRDLLAKRGLGMNGSAWGDADTSKPDLERVKQPF
jgi:hypothetical protein